MLYYGPYVVPYKFEAVFYGATNTAFLWKDGRRRGRRPIRPGGHFTLLFTFSSCFTRFCDEALMNGVCGAFLADRDELRKGGSGEGRERRALQSDNGLWKGSIYH